MGRRSEGCAWTRSIPRLGRSHQHKAGPRSHPLPVHGKPALLPNSRVSLPPAVQLETKLCENCFGLSPRLYLLPPSYPCPTVSQTGLGASVFCDPPAKLEALSSHPCRLPRALPAAATPLGHRLPPGQGALQRPNQAALEISLLTTLRTIIYGANLWHSAHFMVAATLLMLGVPRCLKASTWVVSRNKSAAPETW